MILFKAHTIEVCKSGLSLKFFWETSIDCFSFCEASLFVFITHLTLSSKLI